jgi:PAS domain S-box-containing protein
MDSPGETQMTGMQELKLEEVQEGLFRLRRTYEPEYDYFFTPSSAQSHQESIEDPGHHIWMERFYKHLRGWDAQQVLANGIASLIFAGAFLIGLRFLKFRHSFPRHKVLGKPDTPVELTDQHLLAAMYDYQARTKRDLDEIRDEISEQMDDFLKASGKLTRSKRASISNEGLDNRPDVREVLNELRQVYPDLNGSKMLHEESLKAIFKNEGVDVEEIDHLPLLSVFLAYTDNEGKAKKAVVLKKGLHQALRDFLLAHELGHWFLHMRSGYAEQELGSNYYLHSSPEWMPLEFSADAFAMAALFPAPFLADCEIKEGELTTERLFELFTEGMSKPVPEELSATMINYIDKRIKRYKDFKDLTHPLRIFMSSIKEEHVDSLLEILGGTDARVRWVLMDHDGLITDASDNFIELFGQKRDEIVNNKRPSDLVTPEDRELMRERADIRMKRLEPIYYYTSVVTPSGPRQVVVYSFPTVRDGKYVGAIGILIPLDEVNLEAHKPLDVSSE